MAYRNCPHCGSSNRVQDPKCYSCDKEIEAVPESAPGEPPAVAPSAFHHPPKMNRDRSSNWRQGLRSGLKAGLFLGVLRGMYAAFFGGLFASIGAGLGGAALASFIVFAIVVVITMVQGAVTGAAIGSMDELCYQYDASRTGSLVGLGWCLLWVVTGNMSIFDILGFAGAAGFGAVLGWMASFFEKRSRGQYAEGI